MIAIAAMMISRLCLGRAVLPSFYILRQWPVSGGLLLALDGIATYPGMDLTTTESSRRLSTLSSLKVSQALTCAFSTDMLLVVEEAMGLPFADYSQIHNILILATAPPMQPQGR